MKNNEDIQPFIYFGASLMFSFGFLLVLINGYYHYNYLNFLSNGRKDLIARLGFLAYANGFLFFPLALIPVVILTWISTKNQHLKSKTIWIYSILGIISIGTLFYSQSIDNLIYGIKENWITGILLICLSIFLFWNKFMFDKFVSKKGST